MKTGDEDRGEREEAGPLRKPGRPPRRHSLPPRAAPRATQIILPPDEAPERRTGPVRADEQVCSPLGPVLEPGGHSVRVLFETHAPRVELDSLAIHRIRQGTQQLAAMHVDVRRAEPPRGSLEPDLGQAPAPPGQKSIRSIGSAMPSRRLISPSSRSAATALVHSPSPAPARAAGAPARTPPRRTLGGAGPRPR